MPHTISIQFTCIIYMLVVFQQIQNVFGIELLQNPQDNSPIPPIPRPILSSPPTEKLPPMSSRKDTVSPVPTTLDTSPGHATTTDELDVKRITAKIIEIAHSTEEDHQCIQELEEDITEAIENIRRQDWSAAKQRLLSVEKEYNLTLNSTPSKPFYICDRALLHTCHPTKNTCGCSENELSFSAAQRISTAHRYLSKENIKSYYCYASTGPCNADPTNSIISMFQEQYQRVYEHYGNPNVEGNHHDKYNCLKNLCAALSDDHTVCAEDINKTKSVTHLKGRIISSVSRLKNINRIHNKMRGTGFHGNKIVN